MGARSPYGRILLGYAEPVGILEGTCADRSAPGFGPAPVLLEHASNRSINKSFVAAD